MTVIFECKTTDGHIIKILAELLNSNIKTGCFIIDDKGIKLRMTDSNKRILIDFYLKSENFYTYVYNSPEKSMNIGLNQTHFYKMLKSIKKKDSLVLFIDEKNSTELGIKILPKENNRTTTSFVKIQNIQYLEIDLPSGYGKPIIVPSNEFLKLMKDMNNIGSIIKITSSKHTVKFFCDAGSVYSREVVFGDEKNEKEDEIKSNYVRNEQDFDTEQLVRISKISGLNSFLQIYQNEELPILFSASVGNIGNISIFVKTKKQLEEDQLKYSQ